MHFLMYGFSINPFAQSHRNTSLPQWYRRNEMEKEESIMKGYAKLNGGSSLRWFFQRMWWDGKYSNSSVQESCCNVGREEQQAIQQDDELD